MNPTVSVVITNFNYGRFLPYAVQSALDQIGADVEVVVVDDGSTDDSRDVIATFATRVHPVYTANGGQGAAFNAGWRKSSGEIVIFLDADDVLFPHTAERVVAAFTARPDLSRVQFPLTVIDADGHPNGMTIPPRRRHLFDGDAVPALLSCPDDIVWQPTSGNAFSRRSLDQILPMPEGPYRICADYYLSNLAPLHGPVAALPAPGGGYRVHGGNSHFLATEHLDHLREMVLRTNVTHIELIKECRRLGLSGLPDRPEMVRSVTSAANRLISCRLDQQRHPFAGDTKLLLVRLGIRSAAARRDVPTLRRLAMAAWFVAAAVAPRRLVPVVARPYMKISANAGDGE